MQASRLRSVAGVSNHSAGLLANVFFSQTLGRPNLYSSFLFPTDPTSGRKLKNHNIIIGHIERKYRFVNCG